MKIINSKVLLSICFVFLTVGISAQQVEEKKKSPTFKPLKFNITEDGSQWVRFILWNQFQLNSNDLDSDDDLTITPNVRRSRLLVLGQVAPKIFAYFHAGVNNVNAGRLGQIDGSDQTQLFLHDAALDYKFSDAITVGGGLHYWNGLTRLGSWAGLTTLTFDIPNPLIHVPSIGATDQFARHIGVYAKGKLDKFDYRVALNDPSLTSVGTGFREDPTTASTTNEVYGAWNYVQGKGRSMFTGNIKYNFIGSEGNLLPYVVGTYLGKKKTLAASFGWVYHANSTIRLLDDANPILATDDNATIESKVALGDAAHFSFDVNYDTPIGDNGGALTAYAAYINYDYGENGGSSAGATGNAFYGQAGFLIPQTKLQPYIAYQNRNYDDSTALGTQLAGTTTNLGVNYYVAGHNLRLTLEYIKNSFDNDAENSSIRFQTHIFF